MTYNYLDRISAEKNVHRVDVFQWMVLLENRDQIFFNNAGKFDITQEYYWTHKLAVDFTVNRTF